MRLNFLLFYFGAKYDLTGEMFSTAVPVHCCVLRVVSFCIGVHASTSRSTCWDECLCTCSSLLLWGPCPPKNKLIRNILQSVEVLLGHLCIPGWVQGSDWMLGWEQDEPG